MSAQHSPTTAQRVVDSAQSSGSRRRLPIAIALGCLSTAAYLRVLCPERNIKREFSGQKGRAAEYQHLCPWE